MSTRLRPVVGAITLLSTLFAASAQIPAASPVQCILLWMDRVATRFLDYLFKPGFELCYFLAGAQRIVPGSTE